MAWLTVFRCLLYTSYYAIIDEVVDETDDTLENYAGILIEHVLHDPSLLETEGSLMSFYKFRPISEKEGNHYQEVFYDSTVYIELEDENEPVRVMRTAFRMPDGQFYELTPVSYTYLDSDWRSGGDDADKFLRDVLHGEYLFV